MAHFTPEQLAALKIELALPEYAGMTDIEIAGAINVKTYQAPQDISRTTAITALVFTGAGDWGNLAGVANGVITAGVTIAERVRAISIKELFSLSENIPMANQTNWDKFVVAFNAIKPEITSQQGLDAITALRYRTAPLWEKFLYRPLEWSDIAEARTL